MTRKRFKALLPLRHHGRCVYCGDPSEHRDHWRPWALHGDPRWVPACGGCNGLLRDLEWPSFGARYRHVAQRLRTRHQAILRTDFDAALDGTTGRLREALRGSQAQAEWVEARLEWLTTVGTALEGVSSDDGQGIREALCPLLDAIERGRVFEE